MPSKKSSTKEPKDPSRASLRARGTAPEVAPLSDPDDLWKKKKSKAISVPKLVTSPESTTATPEATQASTAASEEPVETPQSATPTVPSLPGTFPNSPVPPDPPIPPPSRQPSESTTSQMPSSSRVKPASHDSELDGSLSDVESPEPPSQSEFPEGPVDPCGSSHSKEELALARRQKQPEVADAKSQRSVDETLDWLKHNVSHLITLVSDQLAKNSAIYEPAVKDLQTSTELLSQESNVIRALQAGLSHKVADLQIAQAQLSEQQKSLHGDVDILNVDFLTLHKDLASLEEISKAAKKAMSEFPEYQRYTDENILLLADLEKKFGARDATLSTYHDEIERQGKELQAQRFEIGKQNTMIATQRSSIGHNAVDLKTLAAKVEDMKSRLVRAVKKEVDDEMARQKFINSPSMFQTTTIPSTVKPAPTDKSIETPDKPVPPDISAPSETSPPPGMSKVQRKPQITFLPGAVAMNPPL